MTTILLVEDYMPSLELTAAVLENHGYQVIKAQNGEQALEMIRKEPPDIIASDILMPVMDGFTLCRKIKNDPELSHIPFIFITATYVEPEDQKLAEKLGAEGYIVKTYTSDVFMDKFQQIVDRFLLLPRPSKNSSEIDDSYFEKYHETVNRKLHEKIEQLEKTNRRLEEKEYIIESCTNIIATCDLKGKMTYVNPAFLKTWGYADQREILGRHFSEFWVVSDRLTEIEDALFGKGTWCDEIKAVKKNGAFFDVQVTANTVYDRNGAPIALMSDSTDITARKLAEKHHNELELQLQKAAKMESINTLAAGVAHQFNNALSVISGNLDLLEINSDSEAKHPYFREMHGAIDRMAHLTAQLLAYARGGKYQAQTISLNLLVKNTLALIEHTINPSIKVEVHFSENVPDVSIDSPQMQMVLSAILNNASEAINDRGCIRIRTGSEIKLHEKLNKYPGLLSVPYATISIEDDGKGMDDTTRNRLFEPFYTTKFQGRGLGMAASYGIVRNHGGWITVQSTLNKGTCVRIFLPALTMNDLNTEWKSFWPDEQKPTVLLIEDEKKVLNPSQVFLRNAGYHVIAARSGKEAIDLCESSDQTIDLFILDLILSDMPAIEVYRQISGKYPNSKTVLCSGYPMNKDAQTILDEGAHLFIRKPSNPDLLYQRLAQILQK